MTDNDPRIEYSAWVRPLEITRVLPRRLGLYNEPALENADATTRSAIAADRQSLYDFYAAGIAACSGDRALWNRMIEQALAHDSNNHYYRWITGGRN